MIRYRGQEIGRTDPWGLIVLLQIGHWLPAPFGGEVIYRGAPFQLLMYGDGGRLIPATAGGRASILPAPSCNYFSQALGLLEIYDTFSLSLTFKRHYKEKRKLLAAVGANFFFLPLLSDLAEFRRKLFLDKAKDEKMWNVPARRIHQAPSLLSCVKSQRMTVACPVTHSTLVTEPDLESGQRVLPRAPGWKWVSNTLHLWAHVHLQGKSRHDYHQILKGVCTPN